MWKAWTNGLLGLWLIIAAFLNMAPSAVMWDNLLVGLIIAIVGILMIKEKPWQGWLGAISGTLLFLAAFIGSLQTGAGYLWTDLILGTLAAVAGFGAMNNQQGGVESK